MLIKSLAAACGCLLFCASISSAATIYASSAVTSSGAVADGAVSSARDDIDNAFGAADGKFYSLNLGGWAVFGFGQGFVGPASVLEVTWSCSVVGDMCGYPERVEVLTSSVFNGLDLAGFTSQGFIGNAQAQGSGGALALAPGTYSWLALRDVTPSGPSDDGFDVDSVGVTAAVPLPAAGLLLAGGLAGFGLIGWKRRAV